MSQQEFLPPQNSRSSDEELYQLQYPYSWSGQEGMPRDEPLMNSAQAERDQANYREYAEGQPRYNQASGPSQVPWWARPQPRLGGQAGIGRTLFLVVLFALLLGMFGLGGTVIGVLGHILGAILGLILGVLVFVIIILGLIARVIGRAFGAGMGYDRRAWRRQQRMAWRMQRRAWRGRW